jgi:hypothetical protein
MAVQIDSMDDRLRWSIWNFIDGLIVRDRHYTSRPYEAVQDLATAVMRLPRTNVRSTAPVHWLQPHFADAPWHLVYELLEHAVHRAHAYSGGIISPAKAIAAANQILEAEHSGFRFIGGALTRVMHAVEAEGVEGALAAAKVSGLDGVHEHISQALALFGKRPDPDYRNAIKEAISAVEGTVKLIEDVRGGGLQDALDALAKKADIHKALREGLVKLYGFTSDASGIRHPLMEATTVGEEDARFMIVTCSAAVNWIITKAEKAGLLKRG